MIHNHKSYEHAKTGRCARFMVYKGEREMRVTSISKCYLQRQQIKAYQVQMKQPDYQKTSY